MSMCSFPALLSLCEYQATRKSLVKITSLIYNCSTVKVYSMEKLVRVLRNFGIAVSNPNHPYVLLILFPKLCQSVHSIWNCNQRIRPCKQHFYTPRHGVCTWSRETLEQSIERFVTHFNARYVVLAKFSQRPLWHTEEEQKVALKMR